MTIIIILLIVFIIIVMPIDFIMTYNDKKSDVDIKLIKLFNIRLDIDEFLRFLVTTKGHRDEITLEGLFYKLGIFLKSRNIIRWVSKLSYVKKITIIAREDYENYLMVVNTWIIFSQIQSLLRRKFYRVYDEHYMVDNDSEFKLSFQVKIQMRILFAIIAILLNIKDIFKIIKFMRVYYGKSNL